MNKTELIELVKKLLNEEDLSKHVKEVAIVKEEARKISYRDSENYADSKLTDEFNKHYSELEKRIISLRDSIIDEKKALVEKAKNVIKEKNFKKANDELNKVFEEFKLLGQSTKEVDDKLWAELKQARDTFNKNRQDYYDFVKASIEKAKLAKQEIISKAKEALEMTNFKEANNTFNNLMNSWKQAGFAGKENDDSLWAEFSKIRKEFFAKKEEYFDKLNKQLEEKASKKEELVKKAKMLLANSEFTDEEINKVKELRQAWKEIGFAGKDKEDELWSAFNQTITKYFDEMKFYKKK